MVKGKYKVSYDITMSMDKPKNQPTDLILNSLDNTASWTMREEGDTLGATYAGTFVFKCFLSPLDTLASGRLYRELLGPNPNDATETERFIAFILSQLSKRIVKAPPFWNTDSMIQGNIPDVNILTLVLDRAMSAEMIYKEGLNQRRAEALKKAQNAATAIQESLTGKEKEEEGL